MSTLLQTVKKRETAVLLLLILFTTLSFGLGYLFAKRENPAPIVIQKVVSAK